MKINAGTASRLTNPVKVQPTSDSTAKQLARLVLLSRSTKNVFGDCFTLHIRFAFGHGGDPSGYVA